SRTFAASCWTENGHTTAVKLLDARSGQEKLNIPITTKNARVSMGAFSPDGKAILGFIQVLDPARRPNLPTSIKCWDTTSGRELPPVAYGNEETVLLAQPSPDGRRLAVIKQHAASRWLQLFDFSTQRLLSTIDLGASTKEEVL